jgi:hypothetical protein
MSVAHWSARLRLWLSASEINWTTWRQIMAEDERNANGQWNQPGQHPGS